MGKTRRQSLLFRPGEPTAASGNHGNGRSASRDHLTDEGSIPSSSTWGTRGIRRILLRESAGFRGPRCRSLAGPLRSPLGPRDLGRRFSQPPPCPSSSTAGCHGLVAAARNAATAERQTKPGIVTCEQFDDQGRTHPVPTVRSLMAACAAEESVLIVRLASPPQCRASFT